MVFLISIPLSAALFQSHAKAGNVKKMQIRLTLFTIRKLGKLKGAIAVLADAILFVAFLFGQCDCISDQIRGSGGGTARFDKSATRKTSQPYFIRCY